MRQVRSLLTDNLWFKLAGLLLALFLWTHVTITENPVVEREIQIRVEVENVPAGLAVVSQSLETARVRVQGLRWLVEQLDNAGTVAVANLERQTPGQHEVDLRMKNLPSGVGLAPDWTLPRLRVELEREANETRPVSVSLVGKPAPDYLADLDGLRVNPTEVTVGGPASAVSSVIRVVASVDVTDASTTVQAQTEVVALNSSGEPVSGVTLEPRKVEVTVPLTITKPVTVKADIGPPDPGYTVASLSVNPLTIVIKGKDLDEISSVSTTRISLQGVRGTRTFTVGLQTPPGVSPMDFNSVKVTVTLVEQPEPEAAPGTGSNEGEEDQPAPASQATAQARPQPTPPPAPEDE